MSNHAAPTGSSVAPVGSSDTDDEIDLRELVGVLLAGRLTLIASVLIAVVLALAYCFVATPIFDADALVQVELEENSLDSALGDMAEMLSSTTPVTAEIEIVKSRMVVGKVVDQLTLDIRAEPKYFPLIGNALARRFKPNEDQPLADPFLGLEDFAWGGESIEIGSVQVPNDLLDRPLVLYYLGQERYELFDGDGERLLSGQVGTLSLGAPSTSGEGVRMFVTDIVARPQTRFEVTKYRRLDIVNSLSGRLSVTEKGKDSGILLVQLEGADRQRITDTVNALVTVYQRQNVERKSAEAAQTLTFLETELPRLRKQLDASESALNQYRLEEGSADLTKETELVLQQVVELETTRVGLEQQREQALQRFTPQHPSVQAIDGQLAQIRGEQKALEDRIKQLPETQQALLRLKRDVDVNTTLYTALLNNSQELQLAKAGTVGNVRIIDYAEPASDPSKPKKSLILAVSIVLGGFIGMVLIFIRRALHSGVEDPMEVERMLGLPTYASIPFADEQMKIQRLVSKGRAQGQILAHIQPNNVAVEALRSLRTALHFALLEAENNIIMLTGPSPGLGKSFVSINLGAVLAGAGQRVMVLDADMRRGHLHEYVASGRAPGLSDYIAGDASLADVTRDTVVENLKFISTGTTPPNPAELLLSESFSELLKKLSAEYDHVLVDTPPVLAVTDAAVIGRQAGCSLLVLKAGEHPMRMVEECVRRLQNSGVALKGTLFNQMGRQGGKYGYGYGYGYGYAYYEYYSTKN